MSAGCGRDPPRKRARPSTASPGGGSQGERPPPLGPRQEGPGGSSPAGGSPAIAVGNKGLYRPPRGRGSGQASASAGRGRGLAGGLSFPPSVPSPSLAPGCRGTGRLCPQALGSAEIAQTGLERCSAAPPASRDPRSLPGLGGRRRPGAPPGRGVRLCSLLHLCCASVGLVRCRGQR